nr:immunoglobulin heavy chain junction region [Macaca mulatta]
CARVGAAISFPFDYW